MTPRSAPHLSKFAALAALASGIAIAATGVTPASASIRPHPGPIVDTCAVYGYCAQTTTHEWQHNMQGDVRATSLFPTTTSRTVQYHLSCTNGYTVDASGSTVPYSGGSYAEVVVAPGQTAVASTVTCDLSQTVWGSYATTVACGDGQYADGKWHAWLYFSNNTGAFPSYGC